MPPRSGFVRHERGVLAERLLAVHKRYQLACYVTPELFEAFGRLARSRQMSVTGLLRRLVVAELDGATLLPTAATQADGRAGQADHPNPSCNMSSRGSDRTGGAIPSAQLQGRCP